MSWLPVLPFKKAIFGTTALFQISEIISLNPALDPEDSIWWLSTFREAETTESKVFIQKLFFSTAFFTETSE
jgi:hypothetical protein